MATLRYILPVKTLQEIPIGGEVRLTILPEQEKTLRAAASRLRKQGEGIWSICKQNGLLLVKHYI